jgi:hypothetical protein
MFHSDNRQLDAGHLSYLSRPETTGVYDMVGDDGALIRDHVPRLVGVALQLGYCRVTVNLRAVLACRLCECMGCAVRIEVAFHRIIECANDLGDID